jgi:hypothetical protein
MEKHNLGSPRDIIELIKSKIKTLLLALWLYDKT